MLALPLPKPLPLVRLPKRLQRRPQDLGQQVSSRDAFRAADDGVRDVEGGEDGLGDGRLAGRGDAVDDEGGGTRYRGLPGGIDISRTSQPRGFFFNLVCSQALGSNIARE